MPKKPVVTDEIFIEKYNELLVKIKTGKIKNSRGVYNILASQLGIKYKQVDDKLRGLRKKGQCRELFIGSTSTEPQETVTTSTNVEIDGNKLIAEITSKGIIKNVDDLITACNINMEEYLYPKNATIGTWTTPLKLKISEEKNGKKTIKHVPSHIQNYKVSAIFIRKQPQALEWPQIQPIEFTATRLKQNIARTSLIDRALIIPDPQFGFSQDRVTNRLNPYHDRRVLDIALTIAGQAQPNTIIFNGDLLDLAGYSTHFTREPGQYFTVQPAIIECAWWLLQFRITCPGARIIVMEGNHDKRITSYLQKKAMETCDLRPADDINGPPLVSIERLLGLKGLDIEYIGGYPDEELKLREDIRVVHGNIVRSGKEQALKESEAMLEDYKCHIIYGHTHRTVLKAKTLYPNGVMNPRVYYAYSPGATCRIDGVVPAYKKKNEWQQGIGLIDYDSEGSSYAVTPIQVNNGLAIFDQCLLSGDPDNDIGKRIAKDTEYTPLVNS